MKFKKNISLFSSFSLALLSPVIFSISCSNNKVVNEQEKTSLKNYLDSFLTAKLPDAQNNNYNNLVISSVNQINKTENRLSRDYSNTCKYKI